MDLMCFDERGSRRRIIRGGCMRTSRRPVFCIWMLSGSVDACSLRASVVQIMCIVLFSLKMRATSCVPLTMPSTQVLADELTLTSGKIACINLLRRVCTGQIMDTVFHHGTPTHDSIDGGTGVPL